MAKAKKPSQPELATGVPLGEIAKQRIIQGIQEREFRPGARIPEREICESLGISRTPVREAVRQLQAEGLLVLTPHQGVVVAELSIQQITEIYAIRKILEEFACANAARFATDAEIVVMESILDRSEQMTDDLPVFHRLGKSFHNAIYRAARNQYVLQILEGLDVTFSLLPGLTYEVDDRLQVAMAEHRALFEAIRDRDEEKAKELARIHMENAQKVRLKICTAQIS